VLDAGLEVDLAERLEAGPLVEAAGVHLRVQLDRGSPSSAARATSRSSSAGRCPVPRAGSATAIRPTVPTVRRAGLEQARPRRSRPSTSRPGADQHVVAGRDRVVGAGVELVALELDRDAPARPRRPRAAGRRRRRVRGGAGEPPRSSRGPRSRDRPVTSGSSGDLELPARLPRGRRSTPRTAAATASRPARRPDPRPARPARRRSPVR
jgi:hypothetical protein